MKRKKRLVAILLALTLVFQMSAFSATSVFAEGEEITPAATEQQLDLAAPAEDSSEPAPAVQESEPAVQESAPAEEAPAPAVEETPIEAETPAPAQTQPAEETPAVAEAPAAAEQTGSDSQTEKALASPAEEAPVAKPAADATYTVTLHLYSWDLDGNYTVVKDVKKTVRSGGQLYVSLSSYVTNKDVEKDGKMYHATALWKDEAGGTVNSYVRLSYAQIAELAGEGTTLDLNYYVSYRTDVQLSLYFKDIRHADGTITEAEKVQTINGGNGSGFSKKTIESTTGLRTGQSFSYAGYKYTYTGEWMDEDGNIVDASSTIWFYNKEGVTSGNEYYIDDDVTITLYPVWETEMIQGLDYKYIDNYIGIQTIINYFYKILFLHIFQKWNLQLFFLYLPCLIRILSYFQTIIKA